MLFKTKGLRLSLFFASFSLGIALALSINDAIIIKQGLSEAYDLMLLGMLCGPVLLGYFYKKSSIYMTAISLITLGFLFLCLISIGKSSVLILLTANLVLGMLVSSFLCLYPFINYFMRGSLSFIKSFLRNTLILFCGLMLTSLISSAKEDFLMSDVPSILCLCLFLISFFTLFSAWKHRLVLLK